MSYDINQYYYSNGYTSSAKGDQISICGDRLIIEFNTKEKESIKDSIIFYLKDGDTIQSAVESIYSWYNHEYALDREKREEL